MSIPSKSQRPKKCRNANCRAKFTPARPLQIVCSMTCALAVADVQRVRAQKEKDRKERAERRAARARVKPKAEYMKEAQAAFNAWVRERDRLLPCISCDRHHQGKYDAGHYRTVGSNPALRFEPLNCHKQCVPCNQHKSGDIVNYRLNLVRRIGTEAVDWLEGSHPPKRYTIEELQAIKAHYRALVRHLQRESK